MDDQDVGRGGHRSKNRSWPEKMASMDNSKRRIDETASGQADCDNTLGLSPVKMSRKGGLRPSSAMAAATSLGDFSFDFDDKFAGLLNKENESLNKSIVSVASEPGLYSEQELFRKAAETSLAKCDMYLSRVQPLPQCNMHNMTFRRPDQSFDGLHMSAYFGLGSETLPPSPFVPNSGVAEPKLDLDVTTASYLDELSSADATLDMVRKLTEWKRNKKTERPGKQELTRSYESNLSLDSSLSCSKFTPSSDSTHIESSEESHQPQSTKSSNNSRGSKTRSIDHYQVERCTTVQVTAEDAKLHITPNAIKLNLPVFITHILDYLQVENQSPYMLRCSIKVSPTDSATMLVENHVQDVSIPPSFKGSLGAKIHITALDSISKGFKIEVHSQALIGNNFIFTTPTTIDFDLQSEDAILHYVATVGEKTGINTVEINLIQSPKVHNLEYRFNRKFDSPVPLKFTLSDPGNISFPIGQLLDDKKGKRRSSPRLPDRHTFLTVVTESAVSVPIAFNLSTPRKKLETYSFELSAALDSTAYPHAVNITRFKINFWPKGKLATNVLQVTPTRVQLQLSTWHEVCFRNKSSIQAVEVIMGLAFRSGKRLDHPSAQFKSAKFTLPPSGKYVNGIFTASALPDDAVITASYSGGDGEVLSIMIPVTSIF